MGVESSRNDKGRGEDGQCGCHGRGVSRRGFLGGSGTP